MGVARGLLVGLNPDLLLFSLLLLFTDFLFSVLISEDPEVTSVAEFDEVRVDPMSGFSALFFVLFVVVEAAFCRIG